VIAFAIDGRFVGEGNGGPAVEDADIYVAINGGDVATAFLVPPSPGGKAWRRVVDTSLPSPQDIMPEGGGEVADGSRYPVGPFSLIVLATQV
jgi:glycogen operon protein